MVSTERAWSEIEDALLDAEPDYDEAPEPLPDLEAVNRELRRVARIRRERDTYRDLVETEIARLREKLAEKDDQTIRRERWHLDRLRRFHEAALARDPRSKTIGFPNGKLKARAGQPSWEIDDGEFIDWARANGAADLLRVTYAPDRVTMKHRLGVVDGHAVTPDGEVIPGIEVNDGETSFTVDTSDNE